MAKGTPAKRGRASAAKATKEAEAATAAGDEEHAEAAPVPEPAKKRTPAKKHAAATADAASAGSGEAVEAPGAEAAPAAKIKAPAKRKAAAKPAAGGEDDEAEVQAAAKKPAKRSRAKSVTAAAKSGDTAAQEGKGEGAVGEEGAADAPAPKKSRKKKEEGPPRVVYSEALRPPAPDKPFFKIMSWNVAGLRGVITKQPDFMAKLLAREAPDVVCLQETKISDKHTEELLPKLGLPEGWHASWSCSQDKPGYSGVATFSRVAPVSTTVGMDMPEHDGEGRLLISEFKSFYLLNVYVPNSGEGLKRLDYRVKEGGWDDSLAALVKKLQQTKPVILTGDLNCAHKEIDIHNPKTNLKSAGFTPEERASFGSRLLGPPEEGGCGLVDTYREQHPEVVGYTYYSHRNNCRAKGIGWRLDYNLCSQPLKERVHDSWMLPDVLGSDHVPLGLTLLGSLNE